MQVVSVADSVVDIDHRSPDLYTLVVGVAAAIREGFGGEVAVFVVALFKLSDEGDLIIGIVRLQLIGDVALFACGGESVAVTVIGVVLYCFSVLSDSSESASGIIAVSVGGLFALEGLYLFSDLSGFVSVELHPKECIRLPAKFSVEVVVACLCVAAVCDSHI